MQGTYVKIKVCTPWTLKIYQVEVAVLVSVRIFVDKMNTYRLKRWNIPTTCKDENLNGSGRGSLVNCRGSRVNCRGSRKLSRVQEQSVFVYHCGDLTCPSKPSIPKQVEDVRQTLRDNPALTPSQIKSNVILSIMKQRSDWALIKKVAVKTLEWKWITNEKQKSSNINEPHGHNFETVVYFIQFSDSRDPF